MSTRKEYAERCPAALPPPSRSRIDELIAEHCPDGAMQFKDNICMDKYAVIGHPISHSQSPRIHTLFAQQTGQAMTYDAILAPLAGFIQTVDAFRAQGGKGMSVTVPFKEEACRMATRLSDRAQAAGAVNTLIFSGDDILGENTDGAGLVRDMTRNLGMPITDRRILLIGAGGAARGVILPLIHLKPAALVVTNRTASKAETLARAFGIESCPMEALSPRAFDIVINATSSGLSESALDLPNSIFAPGCLAYDMMYGRTTPFMAQAHAAHARVADGLGMLVEQASEAFFLWRGVRPESAPVLATLRKTLP